MRYGSVCSGIEAASVAWEPLGWQPQFFSEIETFPSAVLAHHWPNVPNLGDMTKHKEWPDAAINVLVGGTPCQSFSVAGLRKGMADPRGNLALTYLAIADQFRPRWLVWENVPGVLSSNGGRDFGAFLGGLGQIGYGFAYRVLDAQHFGVAQRRRRVFVVGYLGDWRPAAAVLFERHSLSGHPAPSRSQGQDAADDAGSRVKSPSHWEGGPHPTLNQSHNTGGIGASNQELFSQRGAGIVGQTVALRGREGGATAELGGEVATALRASTGGGDKPHVLTVHGTPTIAAGLAVRRLTPKEAERLQGLPDSWTKIPWRNRPAEDCPDGPRYKAIGNSMAVPVMRWIGERIQLVDAIL